MPDELRVRLLGGLDIEGVPARALGSRKARTLVKLLALARGATVTTDRTVEALWGDDAPAKPVDQVGVLVSRLRSALGPDRLLRSDAGWSLAVDWLDVAELDARVEEAAARLRVGSPAAALAAARAALELVRGALLADEPDAPWADADRAAVERAVARARVIAAEAALAAGQPADAAAEAERALDHDPYDEAALRVLMRAHAGAGRPASALAAYARVRERLGEDLGVDPTADTEALHTEILLRPDGVAPQAAHRLAGRARELAALDDALAQVAGGAARGIVVEGEAGIGKTALVDAWRSNVAGPLVLTGRCDALGRDLPLQPILDGLAAHVRTADLDVGAVVDAAAGQAQLFANILAVVERAADDRPVVVIVEDVHLAGESTLAWLAFALRRGRRLLVVATTQGGTSLPGARTILLGPLDLDAARELVGSERAEDLFARSGGHPLFLVELANAGDGALPTTVRDAVAARVAGLGEAATTLHAAAVLGATVDVDLLAGVLDVPVPVLLEHVDAGVRAHIVDDSLRFRHELAREALVADTNAARRAYLHREAARVLAGRPRHDPLDVAFHAQHGGDVDTAAAALVEAARIAIDRFDMADAEHLLDRAVELADGPAVRIERAQIRIARWDIDGARADARAAGTEGLEQAAWAEYYGRDYDLALRYAEEAIERATSDSARASCLAMSGRVLHARGDLRGADDRLTRAVASAPPEARGFARMWLAAVRNHQGEPEQAIDLVDRALVDGRWLGHPFVVHQGQFFRVMALAQLGRPVEALAAIETAQGLARASGEIGVRFTGATDNARSWVLRSVGRLEEADEVNLRVFESTGATAQTMEMHCAAALDLLDGRLLAGDLDGTEDAIARARIVDSFEGTMAWHQRQRFEVLQARRALLDDAEAAIALGSAAVDDAVARGATRYELLARVVVALAAPDAIDHDAIDAVLAGLERRAGMEAWRFTAELAAATGSDRWWRDAERRAGALIAVAGPDAETLRSAVAARFSALGRR